MQYQWDPTKAAANREKHRIDFADVVGVFSDPYALTVRDEDLTEERWVTLGMDYLGRIVVVAYTWRGKIIRIISARKATRKERFQYEAGL